MKFDFHPEAFAEFQDAARGYRLSQEGVGLRFVASVEDAIARILEAPLRWRILEDDVRRCLTRLFPYAVPLYRRTGFRAYHRGHALSP